MALTFLQSAVDTTPGTSHTFSSMNLGTESEDRYIVVAVRHSANTFTVTGMTIAGETASEDISNGTTSLWKALVPSGTSGDVVITFGAISNFHGIGMWSLTELVTATPTDTGIDNTNPTNDIINVTPRSAVIAYSTALYLTGLKNCTWSNITERSEEIISGNLLQSMASDEYIGQSTVSPSGEWSNSPLIVSGIFASYEMITPTKGNFFAFM